MQFLTTKLTEIFIQFTISEGCTTQLEVKSPSEIFHYANLPRFVWESVTGLFKALTTRHAAASE